MPTNFFDINLGQLVTIVVTLGAMIMAWQKLTDRIDSTEKRMDKAEKELNGLSQKGVPALCQMHTERLQRIEDQVSLLRIVANDVSWIKSNMQQQQERVRKQ